MLIFFVVYFWKLWIDHFSYLPEKKIFRINSTKRLNTRYENCFKRYLLQAILEEKKKLFFTTIWILHFLKKFQWLNWMIKILKMFLHFSHLNIGCCNWKAKSDTQFPFKHYFFPFMGRKNIFSVHYLPEE